MTPPPTSSPKMPSSPAHATVSPPAFSRIVLTGFMGAGKTTVGRLLANQLGWEFLDLDHHIEQRSGLAVAEVFASHGEAHFRRLESAALANALRHPNLVLALGGGAPEAITNRLLLEQTPRTLTVFLEAPFPILFDRCMLQAVLQALDRPNLRDPAAAQARFAARLPLYRRMAQLTISTEDPDTEQIARRLAEDIIRLR